MAYTKQNWMNNRTGATPINATRLNYMETGIYNAAYVADSVSNNLSAIGETARTNTLLIDDLQNQVDTIRAAMGGGTGGISIQYDMFVNYGSFTASGSWLHGTEIAERPGATNAGNFEIATRTLSTGATGYGLVCKTEGVYLWTMAFRGTTSTSGKRAYMDLYKVSSSGGLTLVQRTGGWDSNTYSGSYLWPMKVDDMGLIGHLSADSVAAPDGVNGATAGTDIGLAIGIVRISS